MYLRLKNQTCSQIDKKKSNIQPTGKQIVCHFRKKKKEFEEIVLLEVLV